MPRGTCCNRSPGASGACLNDQKEADCAYEWTEGAACSTLEPPCSEVAGACCDSVPGQGGLCTETLQSECVGPYLSWTVGAGCSSIVCQEVTGACCYRPLGTCTQTTSGACAPCSDCVWTEAATCEEATCTAIQGACCVRGIDVAECSQTSLVECQDAGGEWARDMDCANIACDPNFVTIPTVSEWGLVVLALMILIGGKVWSIGGRRMLRTLSVFSIALVSMLYAESPAALAAEPLRRALAVDADVADSLPRLDQTAAAAAAPLAVCESTGFEANEPGGCGWELGWICGSTFTQCSGPPIPQSCTGDPAVDIDCCINNRNPLNGWYVSGSNQHCGHPYVSDLNPQAGSRHLRFERNAADGNPPGCTGFGTSCRVNAFTPGVGVYPAAPSTVTMDVAMSAPIFDPALKGSLVYFTVDDANGATPFYVHFHYYGIWFVYDYALSDFGWGGYVYGDGAYFQYKMEFSPCPPSVNYYVDVHDGNGFNLTYSTWSIGAGNRISRGIFSFNNIAGNTFDVDNYTVYRGNTCTCLCGQGVVEPHCEDCEPGVPGPCPAGRCDPTTCRCTPICTSDDPCPLVNGDNGPFIAPFDPVYGGNWHYDGDAASVAYDFCGSAGVDTLIRVYDDAALLAQNDDCCDPASPNCGSFGNGSTPNASCYGPDGEAPPYPSCTCAPNTNPAYGHDVQLARLAPLGASIRVHVSKKAECGGEILGSCCDRANETCVDNIPQSQCGIGEFSADLKCDAIDCTLPRGACCDRSVGAGGTCTDDVVEADCAHEWTQGQTCSTLTPACAEVTGACCDRLSGACNQTLLAACTCLDCVWTQGAACGPATCTAIQGACCVRSQLEAKCTQTSQAQCDTLGGKWSRETDCVDVPCDPHFVPIPTVSEWGLVVLALTMLIGGKLWHLGRKARCAGS